MRTPNRGLVYAVLLALSAAPLSCTGSLGDAGPERGGGPDRGAPGDELGGPNGPSDTDPTPVDPTDPGDDPTPEEPPPPALIGAAGVTLREIALYQGVKRPLMERGQQADSSVPVVQGRDALLRVFYDTDQSYNGKPVTARLHLEGQPPIEVVSALGGGSEDGNLESTINFDVPGSAIAPGTSYRVELLQLETESPTDNPAAVYPPSGLEAMGVDSSKASLRVKLIPVLYGADGSNRAPDTSPAQVEVYARAFRKLYPVSEIEVTVGDPFPSSLRLSASGSGWSELLNDIVEVRARDGAPDDVYYYGIFSPAERAQDFCGGGCVAGLGFVPGPTDAFVRAAIGLGFTGEGAAGIAAHEVGHNHGRPHAPCGGVASSDPGYPHAGGAIGAWGWDIIDKELKEPNVAKDFMGYCDPSWVSDYTFRRLFDRISFLDGASFDVPEEMMNRRYERVSIDGDGNATFLRPVTLQKPPMASPMPVAVEAPSGSESVTGHYFAYDHLPGGVLFVPEQPAPLRSLRVTVGGRVVSAVKASAR